MAFRTCVGCKSVDDKAELLRMVQVEGNIKLDRAGKLPGRGIYVHPKHGCLKRCLNAKLLGHKLKAKSGIRNMSALETLLQELIRGDV